eukprot:gb/GFBE01049586.1/.p1 GENE.gb/GFBE01049586.1/~~gb/GFBE01049586.1/.p1  ORF type:complete len:319 (+),score=101.16 gb/GFBE01049586.1/:1-957(+)
MSFSRLAVILTFIGAIRAAEVQSCEYGCDAEEASLLQGKLQAKDDFPDFGALKDVVGSVVGAANDVQDQLSAVLKQGLSTATSSVKTALQTVDDKVDALTEACNVTFAEFKAAADINGSLGDNITKFQKLLNSTVGKAVPVYEGINNDVSAVLSTMMTLLDKLGQGDLSESMNVTMTRATTKMHSLSDSAKAALSDTASLAESEVVGTLEKVNTAMEAGAGLASEFADSLESSMKDFTDGLKKEIAQKLPQDQQETLTEPLDSLLQMAFATFEKLKRALAGLASDVEESSKTVTESVEAVASKGFFGHIKDFFSGLFR